MTQISLKPQSHRSESRRRGNQTTMSKQTDPPRSSLVAADPSKWSPKSQQSVAFHFMRVYVDEPYVCRRCGRDCVFTAQDKKYTFEIKQARIDQRRSLCAECWSDSHRVRAALTERESRWTEISRWSMASCPCVSENSPG
jgi:hypothetical protein